MSSTPITSPIKASTPTAPVKAAKATKEVKEKVVKEKVVTEKKVKEVKEKAVKEVKEVKEKAVKEVNEKAVTEKKEMPEVKPKSAKKNVVDKSAEDKPVVEKKARAPTLPVKQGKFIQYSYYLLRAINNAALESSGSVLLDETAFFDAAHIFDNIEAQQAFVNGFLENKGIAKEMRTHVAEKKKAEMTAIKNAEKAAKEAIKKEEKAAKEAIKKAAKPKPTTPKGKSKAKKVTATVEPDLVTALVTLANASTVEPTAQVPALDNTEEDELDVRLFTIQSKEYLIDDNNNLYDVNTHAVIGTWDKENSRIVNP